MSNFQANLIDSKIQNRQQAEEKEAKKDVWGVTRSLDRAPARHRTKVRRRKARRRTKKMTKMGRNLCCQESVEGLAAYY